MNSLEKQLLEVEQNEAYKLGEQSKFLASFKDKRNYVLYDAILKLPPMLYNLECQGTENIPKQGPALILPKHHSYIDGVIVGYFIKKESSKYCYFFAKNTLPKWLEKLGGIKFITKSDFKKLSRRIGREQAKQFSKKINKKAYAKIEELLKNNEIITMFPEGKLSAGKMSKLKISPFKYFEQMQKRISNPIPIIPVGIEYNRLEDVKGYKAFLFSIRDFSRKKAIIRFGEPRYFGERLLEELIKALSKDIKKLSNI